MLTPEGSCTRCGELIVPGNRGFVLPHVSGTPERPVVEDCPVHLECHLLNVGVVKEIHVLRYGAALCGLRGVPSEWPEGHKWIDLADKKWVTCMACKRAADAVD